MGELLEIWLKKNHGEPMVALTEAEVRTGPKISSSIVLKLALVVRIVVGSMK